MKPYNVLIDEKGPLSICSKIFFYVNLQDKSLDLQKQNLKKSGLLIVTDN